MAINLSGYASIASALLVDIEVDYYKTSPTATPTSVILRFSDYPNSITWNGNTYLGLGQFLGITSTSSEIKNSTSSLTLTITGIPNTSIAEIVNSRIKGSPISVRRYVMDPTTNVALPVSGNPAGRFFGIVNNYSLEEEWDNVTRTASNTITLQCSSTTELFENKVSGRKTNPTSEKSFYPNDLSMDRVPSLVGANFDFGAPR